MAQFQIRFALLFGFCFLLMAQPVWAMNSQATANDYKHLMEMIQLKSLKAPLVPFSDQKPQFIQSLNQENLAYLNVNQDLLTKIKDRFQGRSLNWKLANSYKRLLIVPENREDYAELFQKYCDEAIEYTLSATQLPNPLKLITTLHVPISDIPLNTAIDQSEHGVTAYIVHNIADEYIEEYQFFSADDHSQAIEIKLRNLEFSGHIGSYQSDIVIGANGEFKFIHSNYTLWQNNAKDPLNVLVAPVEETLHIALRRATETAIQEQLKQVVPQTVDEVQLIVDEWMAVEEAIVGGLVSKLMPEILTQVLGDPLVEEIDRSMADRNTHSQYRYLQKGIDIVDDMGLLAAIDLYKSEPQRFALMLQKPATQP